MFLMAIGLAALRASTCREFNCKGLTTCVENRCQTFLRGDPCEVDTQDVKLYFDFYYLKEIEVTTTCWDNYVTYWIRELGDSPGMTEAAYEAQNQNTLRRVEKHGDDWAAMGRVVPLSNSISIITRCPHHASSTERLEEIWQTVQHNKAHRVQPAIHMLCTVSEVDIFRQKLNAIGVHVHRMLEPSSYEHLFTVASPMNGIKIIMNSDISLHDGFEALQHVIDETHAIALSRHASEAMCLYGNVSQSPGNNQCLHYVGSHDAFIFAGELNIGSRLKGIFPQYWGSENVVLYELKKVRTVTNPCQSIHIYHQHCVAYFTPSKESAPRVNGARSGTVRPSRVENANIDRFKDAGLRLPTPSEYKRDQSESNTISDSKIDKVIVKNSMGFNRDEPCDIPCHYTTGNGPVDATVYELRGRRAPPSGISVYMQMEGEHYYPIDTTDWTVENTYRWTSPILKPYYEIINYKDTIYAPPVGTLNAISFLARNCGSKNHREDLVRGLMDEGLEVHSMSSCLHNHPRPPSDDKVEIMRPYKFHAAFENGNVKDYVTEKVYTAFQAGTLPIYFGAPNIEDFVPPHSIVNANTFESVSALANHIRTLMHDDTLYASYFEWKTQPNSEFTQRFAFTNVSTECRTCRWVYANKHQLPWDHATQTVSTMGQVYPPTRCQQIRARAVEMVEDDGFVPTGDIDDMWIRDSAAQVHPLLDSHPELVRKVIEKQAFYIEFDPYANSYGRTFREPSILGRHGWVTTRNYELDSGAYFIRLVHAYWKRTGEKLGAAAIGKLLSVWRVEQHHANSLYRYDELQDGVGTPVGYTGMTWTGFRPSDDKCMYHYHIPDNVFAAVALGYLEEMGYMIGTLREDIIHGIHMFGVQDGIYCYEVDGLGNCNKMDDANLPSLLSLPYLDPDQTVYDQDIWERTRAFVLSDANPYYYSAKYSGVGSPHTPYNHVWHLSLIVQAIQGDSEALKTLEETASEPGHKASAFHESFHVDNPAKYTRKWFAWADALYLELC